MAKMQKRNATSGKKKSYKTLEQEAQPGDQKRFNSKRINSETTLGMANGKIMYLVNKNRVFCLMLKLVLEFDFISS